MWKRVNIDTNAFVRTKQNASKHLVTLKERPTFGKTLWHSHFGDERPDFAERLPEDPRVLLPIDVEVVGEAWKRQKGREGGNSVMVTTNDKGEEINCCQGKATNFGIVWMTGGSNDTFLANIQYSALRRMY